MSSPDRVERSVPVPMSAPATALPARPKLDQVSMDSAAYLKSALAQLPEVRPEVVARASALAADPSYPSAAIMRGIASQILASPDLSNDES